MEVSISGLPLEDPTTDQYSMRTIRMFAGRTGDVVDVYGNSSHPNATFFSNDNMGFNWAFVASGDDVKNIGVAEVALPPNSLDSDDRAVLMDDYSIRNVFTDEILSVWPNIEQFQIDAYLVNTTPPGYFDGDGFLNAGVAPGAAWDPLAERLLDLTPYNPLGTTNLQVTFKQ